MMTRSEYREMLQRASDAADFCLKIAEEQAAATGQPAVLGMAAGICMQCGSTQQDTFIEVMNVADCEWHDECGGIDTVLHPFRIASRHGDSQ